MLKELLCLLPFVTSIALALPNRSRDNMFGFIPEWQTNDSYYSTFNADLDLLRPIDDTTLYFVYDHRDTNLYHIHNSGLNLGFGSNTEYLEYFSITGGSASYTYQGNTYIVVPFFEVVNLHMTSDANNYFNCFLGYSEYYASNTYYSCYYFNFGGANQSNYFDDMLNYNVILRCGLFNDSGDLYYQDFNYKFSTLLGGIEHAFIFNNSFEYYDSLYFDIIITDSGTIIDNYASGYSTGYATGYDKGVIDGSYQADTIGGNLGHLFLSIADLPLYVIRQLFSFDLFGMSVFVALMSVVSATLVIWLIKKFH